MSLFSHLYKKIMLSEAFKQFGYQPAVGNNPESNKRLMYEFYFICALPYEIKYANEEDKILEWQVKETRKTILTFLRAKLLNEVLFSICAELRHTEESSNFVEYDTRVGSERTRRIMELILNTGVIGKTKNDSYLKDFQKLKQIFVDMSNQISENDSFTAYTHSNKLCNKYFNLKGNERGFVEFAKIIFSDFKWSESFGGKSWADIADGWLKLYDAPYTPADNGGNTSAYIDHIYDLEHNSGTVLDKLKSYGIYDENAEYHNYDWIKGVLDAKREAKDLHEFEGNISHTLFKFGMHVLNRTGGKSVEDYRKEYPKNTMLKLKNIKDFYEDNSAVRTIRYLSGIDKQWYLNLDLLLLDSDYEDCLGFALIDGETLEIKESNRIFTEILNKLSEDDLYKFFTAPIQDTENRPLIIVYHEKSPSYSMSEKLFKKYKDNEKFLSIRDKRGNSLAGALAEMLIDQKEYREIIKKWPKEILALRYENVPISTIIKDW